MKVRVTRSELFDAVNKARTIVTKKTVLPILSHFLLEAKQQDSGSLLKITSSDLRVNIECSLPCEIEEEGLITLSAERLSSVMASFPEEEVVISLGENRVVDIRCAKIRMKLFSMSPDDFPPVRTFEGIEPIVLPQKDLRDLFIKTSFAICTDQARYNLTGLLFELSDNKITCVSTDGRRMSLCRYQSDSFDSRLRRKVTIPGKVITEVERLLQDEGNVEVFLDENQVAFSIGPVTLTSALIEGSFPNYEMVIPKKHDKEVIVDKAVFQESVTRAKAMTNEKFNSVRLYIAGNQIVLRVSTPDVGEYEEEIPAEYEGEEIEIAFNPDFILDVLRALETKELAFILKDATSPGVIKPVLEDDAGNKVGRISDDQIHVIMPIRI
ncbi:MAG TPA: DNA polymerase III subunit beta [Candidatus Hydrogenedentes bacterium]|nr:DNA polymerase III subunit beta [Candidatus Hydrogenedentota bacterium]HOL77885.1 DNA polymerase III subunit beta [Candidatus Hydrogenedentota bacterium]HPO87050.1 DNA polymerase III subunit beta [Candidatus Hydrogenedentota bacterium]